MKKVLLLFVFVLLMSGCRENKLHSSSSLIPLAYRSVLNDNDRNCNVKINFYFAYKDIEYYVVCMDSIGVVFKNTKLFLNLNEAFERKAASLSNLVSMCSDKQSVGIYDVYYYETFNLILDSHNNKVYFLPKFVSISEIVAQIG